MIALYSVQRVANGCNLHGFSPSFGGKINGAPQIPGRDGAVGPPKFAVFQNGFGFGHAFFAVGKLEAFLDAEVVDRQNIHAAQFENQKHFHCPAPDTLDFSESRDQRFVIHDADFVMGWDNSGQRLLSEVLDVTNFGPRKTNPAQNQIFNGQNLVGRRMRNIRKKGVEPAHDSFGRFAAELLMRNGAKKRVEGGALDGGH
jgi:hypothetical protein